MNETGQDAAVQAEPFGEDDSSSANRSGDDGHGGGDAPMHISGLTEPTGRVIFHGDGDVPMHDDPLDNAWPVSGTPRPGEHDERDLEAERQRAALEAEQQLAAEQARAAARQQVERQPPLLLPMDRAGRQAHEEAALRAAERRGTPKTPKFAEWNPKKNSEENHPPKLEGKFKKIYPTIEPHKTRLQWTMF